MGLGDIAGQASEMAGQHGDKVEQASDQGLDKAAQAVNDKTGKDTVKDEHVDKAKDALNDKFGNKD